MIIFCIMYYICSYVNVIPQIIKLIKTKSSNDFSLWQILISFIGGVSWTIYILTSFQSLLVYIGSAIDLLLLVLCDFFILKYYKK